MSTITETVPSISAYTGTIPNKATQTPVEFADNVYPFHLYYNSTFINQTTSLSTSLNTLSGQINTVAGEVQTNANVASASATIAIASANYKGLWVAGYNTTGYTQGMSVAYSDGYNYISNIDNNLTEPTSMTNTTEWNFIEAVSPADLATKLNATNPSISGSITESVYSLTGTDINPTNGTIQVKTMAANTTFTESLSDGQYVVLRLAGGDTYTVTWFTVNWVGGVAPTLTANDALVFWQENSLVYGAYIGTLVQA